jgi:hypothetical protein
MARPLAWAGFAVSLAGVVMVTAGRAVGPDAATSGDGLVLASVVLSAALMVAQPRLLRGRDPVAVTAVQFLGAAAGVLPLAACSGGVTARPSGDLVPILATLALAVAGTLAPFTLFAYGQKRVPAEFAGAVAGVVVFGDPAGAGQVAGGIAILAGIVMSSWRAGGAGSRTSESIRPPARPAGSNRAGPQPRGRVLGPRRRPARNVRRVRVPRNGVPIRTASVRPRPRRGRLVRSRRHLPRRRHRM